MTPREIFDELVRFCTGINETWRVKKWRTRPLSEESQKRLKPGAVINTLSDEKREILKQLTSEEIKEHKIFSEDIIYWCDDFYHEQDEKEKIRKLKEKFDAKLK